MAEEVKEEVAAEVPAEAPAPAAEVNTKSFEERLAELKKPEVVPQPDQDKVNEKLSRLNAQIEKCDKRLSEIKGALDKANQLRDKSKDESKHVIDQLKELRVEMSAASREKEACFQELRSMTQNRQAVQKALQDMRRSLKFEDVGQVEVRVRELEAKISQGECGDLKEEKRVIQEIQQLKKMKATISQYQSQRQTVTDDSETKASLEARKAQAQTTLEGLKKQAEVLEKALEAARAKHTSDGPNVNELWKEQKELYGQIKAHRTEIKQVNGEFKEEMNKWRDYSKAQQSYKRAQGKILADQRRAEWEARKAENNEPVDKDVPSDDPFMGHPWADEIYQCSDLEKVLATFLPKEVKVAEGGDDNKEKAWLKGAAGKNAASEEDNAFAGLVTKKSKKGSKKGGDSGASKKVVLTLDTINSLNAIGVAIPTTTEQITASIEQVKAKKSAFEGMNEDDKKAQKKKAAQAKNSSKPVEGGTAGGLVSVEITATGADKVAVNLDYPALSASA